MKSRPPVRPQTPNAPPLLLQAVQSHQRGNFEQAERLYGMILKLQPQNLDALRQFGILRYQQGRHNEALQSLSAALRAAPNHAAVWSDLGVVHAALGRLEEALACYDRAIALDPNHADAFSNKGNALVGLKRREEALASYDRALAIKPRLVAALANRGGLLRDLGRLEESLACLDKALAIKPDHPDALNNRGNALTDLGRFKEALASFDKALAANASVPNAANNRGNVLVKLGRLGEALASYDKAIALTPHNAEAWNNRGQALRLLKRYEEAATCSKAALAIAPNYANAFNSLANALMDLKRPVEALASYDKALACKPDFVEALTNRAQAYIELGRTPDALASCLKAIAVRPDFAEAHNNLGVALAKLNREEEALACYQTAIVLDPSYALAHENKGVALLQIGRIDEASASLGQAIELAPASARAYHHFALATRFTPGDARFQAMEVLTSENSPLDADERVYVHFALGKAYADVADYERSFGHYARGGATKRGQSGYDESAALDDLSRTASAYTGELMRHSYGRGDPSAKPVFVIGMPRSGTTLIEQILSGHPDVHGAGEISDFEFAAMELGGCAERSLRNPAAVRQMPADDFRRLGANYVARLEALAPNAHRVVNKMPENFRFAGLIALALPNAKIIHVRRDPVDTCFSCFSTLFSERLSYTYDLAELGRYYRAYEALMNALRDVLPTEMMIEVRYEDVVADLEGQSRRLLAHCGLGWDARCLEFHNLERNVRTASVAQVRRPLYKSSVERWRQYESHLEPLFAALDLPATSAQTRSTRAA